jgi:hypothetical protein
LKVRQAEMTLVSTRYTSPPAIGSISYLQERTYRALLGPLGAEPTVWAECLVADPIVDIAVLG